jgi:hypothetical protein
MDRGQPDVAAPEATPVPFRAGSSLDRFVAYVERIGSERGRRLLAHATMLVFVAWVPSILVGYAFHLMFPDQTSPNIFGTPLRVLGEVILAGPLIETLFMRYLFLLLRKFTQKTIVLSAWSAVIWGAAHAIYISWGTHAVWPFFVLSICYLCLEKISLWRAILITTLIHGGCNLLSYLLYLATER